MLGPKTSRLYTCPLGTLCWWGVGVGNNFAGNYCDKCNNKFCWSSEREILVTNSFSYGGFQTHWMHPLTKKKLNLGALA